MNRETAVRHRLAPFIHTSRAGYAALPRVVSRMIEPQQHLVLQELQRAILRHNQLYPLILRSVAKRCVSKDEARNRHRGLMVRDGANAPPHHEELPRPQVLTTRFAYTFALRP